ncbi:MAG: DUF4440 domain-containing protein [Terracidiphilus sp.]
MRFLVASLLCVCSTFAVAQSPQRPQSPAVAVLFGRLRTEWGRNLHAKDNNASVAAYAPDADFLQPDGTRVHGTAALRTLYEAITAAYDSDITFDSQRLEVSGDLAYDSGTYRETLIVLVTRKPQLATGSYLTVYRRNASGAWLIVEQAWTGSIQ